MISQHLIPTPNCHTLASRNDTLFFIFYFFNFYPFPLWKEDTPTHDRTVDNQLTTRMLCPGTKRGAICKNSMISWRFEVAEDEFGREWLSNCREDSSSSSMNLCCNHQSFFCFYTREEGWFCMARAWRRQWRIDVNSNSIFLCTDYGCHHPPLLTAKPVLLWQSKQRPSLSLSLSSHVPCF